MMESVAIVVTGVVSFGLGLSKDIIFSWLKDGGRVDDLGTRKECLTHAERMARAEQRLDQHEIELSDGKAHFDKLRESIGDIEKNVEVLVDRAEMRRKGD